MDVIRLLHQKSFNPTLKLSYGKGQEAAGRRSFTGIAKWLQGIGQRTFMFIIGTWSFEPLKKAPMLIYASIAKSSEGINLRCNADKRSQATEFVMGSMPN